MKELSSPQRSSERITTLGFSFDMSMEEVVMHVKWSEAQLCKVNNAAKLLSRLPFH